MRERAAQMEQYNAEARARQQIARDKEALRRLEIENYGKVISR